MLEKSLFFDNEKVEMTTISCHSPIYQRIGRNKKIGKPCQPIKSKTKIIK